MRQRRTNTIAGTSPPPEFLADFFIDSVLFCSPVVELPRLEFALEPMLEIFESDFFAVAEFFREEFALIFFNDSGATGVGSTEAEFTFAGRMDFSAIVFSEVFWEIVWL